MSRDLSSTGLTEGLNANLKTSLYVKFKSRTGIRIVVEIA